VRILYVENHAVFADTVTRQFLSKHSVIVVPSIAAAKDALRKYDFELLLVDYDLDDGKGDELVRSVAVGKMVIIGVSSHEAGNNALLKAGANAVCSKMEFDKIGGVIARVCG
jgi:DNA-binding response OmpR family regulator